MSEIQLEHKAVEAQPYVANDLGEFTAVAATYDVDRVKDRIRFGAFENTITRWRASGKRASGCTSEASWTLKTTR